MKRSAIRNAQPRKLELRHEAVAVLSVRQLRDAIAGVDGRVTGRDAGRISVLQGCPP